MMKMRCCIVGGGPAGMMLGYLLGRAGVDVVVLEEHADFFSDFRGDTVRCREDEEPARAARRHRADGTAPEIGIGRGEELG